MQTTATVFIATAVAAAAVAAQGGIGSNIPSGVNYVPSSYDMSSMVPSVERVPNVNINTHLARLMSFFDMSHVSTVDTQSPVMVTHVFDPTTNKFTHFALDVVQTGNSYYLPVCSVDSITSAGGDQVVSSPESCQYGIQLTSVPANAVRAKLGLLRTVIRMFKSLAHPSLHFGGFTWSTGMQGMQKGAESAAAAPVPAPVPAPVMDTAPSTPPATSN
ncbi:hypothetical protein GGI07_004330 [Coemansia sp. Benny D115]|nr:hypothetical protein GGI07_004330 [Coemansia sp. Benny D115]